MEVFHGAASGGLDRGGRRVYTCTMTQIRKDIRRPPAAAPAVRTPARACCPQLADLLDARLFRALADGNRLALLMRLAACGRACTVSELNACCPVDLSVVSRHLAILRDAGALQATRRGKEVLYQVRFERLVPLLRGIAAALDSCRCAAESCGPCCDTPGEAAAAPAARKARRAGTSLRSTRSNHSTESRKERSS